MRAVESAPPRLGDLFRHHLSLAAEVDIQASLFLCVGAFICTPLVLWRWSLGCAGSRQIITIGSRKARVGSCWTSTSWRRVLNINRGMNSSTATSTSIVALLPEWIGLVRHFALQTKNQMESSFCLEINNAPFSLSAEDVLLSLDSSFFIRPARPLEIAGRTIRAYIRDDEFVRLLAAFEGYTSNLLVKRQSVRPAYMICPQNSCLGDC